MGAVGGPVAVEWLTLGGAPDPWRALGLLLTDDHRVPFLRTSLLVDPTGEPGLAGWALSGIEPVDEIDGLPTTVVPAGTPTLADHPNGAVGLDHVVVLTDSLDRTCGAIASATGCPLKRVREVGPMRQGFHRIGSGGLVVEVVERPEYDEGRARFWGLVLDVVDLDAAVQLIGADRIGAAKDAVQPGRRIATVRSEAGLGLAVALMSIG